MNVINNKDLDDYLKDKSNEDMGLEIGEQKKEEGCICETNNTL